MKLPQLPLSVTLMLTEKCNLRCKYCYEVFSGNMKAKTMSHEVMRKGIDRYLNAETLVLHSQINWDFVGGEVFVEFELLRDALDYLIQRYRELGLCPKKHLHISLCSNGTLFTPEVRAWCEQMRERIGFFGISVSLDGVKAVHDSQRSGSFDALMKTFEWWKKAFPEGNTKGTIVPETLPHLFENVKFFIEDLGLPRFYINPTFEGPWTERDAEIYGEQLIACAEYFLDRPGYGLLENSNLLMPMHIRVEGKQNWCGSGTHMRAITPDGSIYPCLRGATSRLCPLGHIDTGEDRQKLVPFFLYTKYNDDKECDACEFATHCPSCVMQWKEDTGDIYVRSKSLCPMTKVRCLVSKFYTEHTTETLVFPGERHGEDSMD